MNVDELDDQDRNVLQLIWEGKSDKRIGEELGITRGAAMFHVRRLFHYCGVKTRMELREAVRREVDVAGHGQASPAQPSR